ncbi:MAG: NAD-dependent epimerase [Pseudomonadota bacterium]
MSTLVTGAAGFIGYHTVRHLLDRGTDVVGVDSLDNYYDVSLKDARLAQLSSDGDPAQGRFTFIHASISDRAAMEAVFSAHRFDRVIHLAAQAGVRHSLENPYAYVDSNLVGFTTVLEGCRHANVPHLTYASTSSVYGSNTTLPFREDEGVDHPLQLYAATKRANELMAHSYSHLFGLPTTGLRFFTVYGPWGRPDMAPIVFAKKILAGEPIPVFNYGNHSRDFTYVDDIVDGVIGASDAIAQPDPQWDAAHPTPATSNAPFRILNVGNSEPVALSDFIDALEEALGVKAVREYLPLQAGDAADTYADVSALERIIGSHPRTSVKEGVARFAAWYLSYYGAPSKTQRTGTEFA